MEIRSESLQRSVLVDRRTPPNLDTTPKSQSLADPNSQSWFGRSNGQGRATGAPHPLRVLAALLVMCGPAAAFTPVLGSVRSMLVQPFHRRPLKRVLFGLHPLVLDARARVGMITKSVRVPGATWPETQGKFHRFIAEDDPTFVEYAFNKVTGYACKTPDQFMGTRTDGVYTGSCRVQFTLPGKDDKPKTLEIMRSRKTDNPSFGAVKVKLPIISKVAKKDSRLVVQDIKTGCNTDYSRIRQGDIIRAVSLPEMEDTQADVPWWSRIGQTPVPESEEGMVILDGKSVADFEAALRENERVNGKQGTVVLIVERPVKFDFDDNDRGNLPVGIPFWQQQEPQLGLGLKPIPVPVDDDDNGGLPPGLRPPPGRGGPNPPRGF